MTVITPFLILVLAGILIGSYLIGSINFAIIITKIFLKKDIRDMGSKNAGMTNVFRCVGKFAGFLTFLGDFLKGFIVIIFSRFILKDMVSLEFIEYFSYFVATFALLGHTFPIYYKFKGGKGILVSAGIMLYLNFNIFIVCAIIFIIAIIFTKMVSFSSILMAILFPIFIMTVKYIQTSDIKIIGFYAIPLCFIGGLILYLHRGNIKRIINGEESKIGKKNR